MMLPFKLVVSDQRPEDVLAVFVVLHLKWYFASSIQLGSITREPTTDEPTLKEATSAALEMDMWKEAIDHEYESLKNKKAWTLDTNPNFQPLPDYIF